MVFVKKKIVIFSVIYTYLLLIIICIMPKSCLWSCHSFYKSFFLCTNRINLLNLKESSDRLVIIAKGFLKLSNLHMLIKQKSPSLPRNLALRTFGKLLIVFSTKVNLLRVQFNDPQFIFHDSSLSIHEPYFSINTFFNEHF